jgi:hypothetical protein
MPIHLFEEEELLDAAVDIGPCFVPGVSWIMLVGVSPGVCEESMIALADFFMGRCSSIVTYTYTVPSDLTFANA